MSSPEHEDHGADDDSSTALHCVRRGSRRRRLGDEVFVFEEERGYLHCRSAVVEPFPHAVGVWQNGKKVQVPITELCDRIARGAMEARRLISLERGHVGSDEVERLTPAGTLRRLLPHHRDAGASLGDSTQTLLDLADRLDSWAVRSSDPTRLTELYARTANDQVLQGCPVRSAQ